MTVEKAKIQRNTIGALNNAIHFINACEGSSKNTVPSTKQKKLNKKRTQICPKQIKLSNVDTNPDAKIHTFQFPTRNSNQPRPQTQTKRATLNQNPKFELKFTCKRLAMVSTVAVLLIPTS